MRRPSPRVACAGFSLVELAVALAIAALLTVLLFTLLPLGNKVLDAERQQQELAQAEQALLGYMRSMGHLPSADGDGNGRGTGAAEGWLPVADLGLPARMRIRYQVQPRLAQAPANAFDPLLPEGDPLAVTGSRNGLDLCMQLLLEQRSAAPLAGLGMPVAYYLGHSGMAGHGRAEADAQWKPAAQAMPGTPADTGLATVAAGPGELASRLACTDRLARTQGSAQAAQSAWSALELTRFNFEFREFDIHIAETTRDQAGVGLALAVYAMAEAITNEAIAITLLASGWPPDGLTLSAGAKQLAKSVVSIVKAAKSLASAVETFKEAEDGVEDARTRRDQVRNFMNRVDTLYQDARDTTLTLDRAGLNP
ncbi:prepilin-type N-terminal cleavage/methylation domain-containing protein [Stenotrophomonas acidaminiphila]